MLKILYVIDRLNLGAGRVLYDLVKFLPKEEFSIKIATLYPHGNLIDLFEELNIEIINLNKKSGKDLGLILKLKNLIKKEKFDIVHTHNVDGFEYGVLAAKLAKTKKIIHTAHGKSVKEGNIRKLREKIIHKFISRYLTDYITVSNDLKQYAWKNWCKNKSKIKTIHNGIDTNKFKKININKNYLSDLNIKENNKLIGIVAGLRPVKNHVTLFKAMKIIKKRIPYSKLLVIGDGSEKEKLERLVDRLGLNKEILFLGNRQDIVELWNILDVGCLSSLSECLSITLLEGMACEVPFVATNVGGNAEVIENEKNGFLIKSRDYESMAEKITNLLNAKGTKELIGKEARKTILDNFNINNMIKKYKEIYLR